MSRRRQLVDDTRRRILEAAREMFGDEGFHGVALEELANRAGVGRKTIYYQFGSKLGLLRSLVADISERGAVAKFVQASLEEDDVRRAVRRFVRGTCSVWELERAVCRALVVLAASDEDARAVVEAAYAERRRDLSVLVDRARRSGSLPAGRSARRVTDSLWLLTNFESYDNLRRAGKGVSAATDLLSDLAESLFEA